MPCRAECVRATIKCCECEKPRCVFAEHKLSSQQTQSLESVLSDNLYTCGAPLWPPDHDLFSKVAVRHALACWSPVEAAYYSCRKACPPVCYACGGTDPLAFTPALKEALQSVHPVCDTCNRGGSRVRSVRSGTSLTFSFF